MDGGFFAQWNLVDAFIALTKFSVVILCLTYKVYRSLHVISTVRSLQCATLSYVKLQRHL